MQEHTEHTNHEDPESGLMDTRHGVIDDENQDADAAIPAKRSLGWGVIIPALLWIGLGALIVAVVVTNT